MSVKGPMHAFHLATADDDPMKARAWASPSRRRTLVSGVLVLMAVMSVCLGVVMDAIAGVLLQGEALSSDVTVLSVLLLAGVFLAMWLDRSLFLASRPAFSMPDEPHDERQQGWVNRANRLGLKLALTVLVLVTAIGVSPLPASYTLAAGLVGLALVIAGPQMVIAWSLEASDFDFDGADDEDADG